MTARKNDSPPSSSFFHIGAAIAPFFLLFGGKNGKILHKNWIFSFLMLFYGLYLKCKQNKNCIFARSKLCT
jgi:hypothetical protein